MKYRSIRSIITLLVFSIGSFGFTALSILTEDPRIISYTIDPKTSTIELYWKDDKGEPLKNIKSLKKYVESKGQRLLFAMNAGMYKKDLSPLGLFVQNKKMLHSIDTTSNKHGNFYLKPNGIFYLTTSHIAVVCKTEEYDGTQVQWATQSGPMLIINGEIHPAFQKGSVNLNIRNGVGILPNGEIIFAISKEEVNFYDFADYFKKLGCKNALYLDGAISKMYAPEKKWEQLDGNLGVLIGIIE